MVEAIVVLKPDPGCRKTAVLSVDKWVIRVNVIMLTGGTAFGLATAHGM
ncbi:MAG: hypothetical protein H6668_10195 [Ardenticatenaceae bacterium]|nr:hypothetical protein [Ardenticatenaceae bacterium]